MFILTLVEDSKTRYRVEVEGIFFGFVDILASHCYIDPEGVCENQVAMRVEKSLSLNMRKDRQWLEDYVRAVMMRVSKGMAPALYKPHLAPGQPRKKPTVVISLRVDADMASTLRPVLKKFIEDLSVCP